MMFIRSFRNIKNLGFFYIFLLPIICFILGCSENKGKESKSNKTISTLDTVSKLTIIPLDSIVFRNSYNGPNQLTEKEHDRISNSNPTLSTIDDKISVFLLKALGLVKKHKLILSSFKKINSFVLKNKFGDILNGKADYFQQDSLHDRIYRITINNSSQIAKIDIDGDVLEQVKVALIDFVPGGYKEIAVLKSYYIINGDNYEVIIYKIK